MTVSSVQCSFCNRKLPQHIRYCPHCGTRLAEGEERRGQGKRRFRSSEVLGWLVGYALFSLVCVVAVVCVVMFWLSNASEPLWAPNLTPTLTASPRPTFESPPSKTPTSTPSATRVPPTEVMPSVTPPVRLPSALAELSETNVARLSLLDRWSLSALTGNLAYSADGQWLAIPFGDTIGIYDGVTFQEVHLFEVERTTVTSVTFHPHEQLLAFGDSKGHLHVWDMRTLAATRWQTDTSSTSGITSVAFSPDGKLLAAGSLDKQVYLWDLYTETLLITFSEHTDWVESVVFSPDGLWIASGSWDASTRLWEPQTGELVRRLTLDSQAAVRDLAFHPTLPWLASAGADQTLVLWDIESGERIQVLEEHRDSLRAVTFSPNGELLASAGNDRTVRLWQVSSGLPSPPNALEERGRIELLITLEAGNSEVGHLTFRPDGRLLLSGSDDGMIRIWGVGE